MTYRSRNSQHPMAPCMFGRGVYENRPPLYVITSTPPANFVYFISILTIFMNLICSKFDADQEFKYWLFYL